MNNLLLALAGARREILELCPTERVRFQSLGWAILITSGMAMVSMWFALTSVVGLNPALAFLVALVWALIIMGVDRWLVTSIPIDGSRRWTMAAPRLCLAILIGTLISTPIVLRVFQAEINAQISVIKEQRVSAFLAQEQQSQLGKQVIYWQKYVANLQKVIDSGGQVALNPSTDPLVQSLTRQRTVDQSQAHQYYQQWQCAFHGGAGCTVKRNRSLAQASEESYNQAVAQVAALTVEIQQREQHLSATDAASKRNRYQEAQSSLPSAEQQLSAVQARQNELQQNFDALNQDTSGILIRLKALNQLSGKDFTLNSARFLLFLMFLVIECLPVMVKLLQRPGTYEKILQATAERELREAQMAYRSRSKARTGTMTAAQVPAATLANPEWAYVLQADLDNIWERPTQEAPRLIIAPTESVPEPALIDDSEEYVPLRKAGLREPDDIRTHSASAWPNAGPSGHASSIDLRYSDDDL